MPKHAGISWFAFPLDQPGVTIRPLREMTGEAVFNEVFLDDAVCDAADLIGGEGNGWAVTQTTLYFERTGIGAGGGHVGWPPPGPKGGMLGRRAGDAALDPIPGGDMIVKLPELVELAKARDRNRDPHLRQDLARLHTHVKVGQWNALRAKAEAAKGGGEAIANIGKITQTRITKLGAQLGVDILGADAARVGRSLQHRDGVLAGVVHLRRHRRDPAQHHRRADARPPPGAAARQGSALRGVPAVAPTVRRRGRRRSIARYAGQATVFVSVKISRPSMPHCRPMPDCL